MLQVLSTRTNRMRSAALLVLGCAFSVGAAITGINDNPTGVVLAYLATMAVVIAFVHPWRTRRQYRQLLFAALAGFVVSVVLHNVLDGLAGAFDRSAMAYSLFNGAGVAFFFIALLLCPAGVVVGAVGGMAHRGERQPPAEIRGGEAS